MPELGMMISSLRYLICAILTSAFSLGGVFANQQSPKERMVTLTPEERSYLERNSRVTMCVDPDWMPFERINPQGEHEGIAADIVKLVAQRVGLVIELFPVKNWEESIEASKKKQCQILSFLNQTPEREQWLIFTSPIFFDQNIIITREDHEYIGDPKRLSNESVALPRGTMVEERIRSHYPNLQVVTTETEQEAIAMVSTRQVDMTVRSLIVAAYTIKREGLFNLKISGQLPEFNNVFRIGVAKDEVLLRAILDKGVQTLTDREREEISNRHVSVRVHQVVDHGPLLKILAVVLAILLGIFFWYRKLREIDRERASFAERIAEQERHARREQSRFLALLSHEIRTPVAMIDAAGRSLKMLVDAENDQVKLRLDRIEHGVKQMIGLTEQFLVKDRLDDQSISPKRAHIVGHELCYQLVAQLSADERIQVQVSGDTQLYADPELLQVALRNLLVNALRYSPAGTPVLFSCFGESEHVVFVVSDDGPGIASEEVDIIFNPYFRGNKTKDKPGAGLGLYLVKRVVDMHGGTIDLQTQLGQGASFRVEMPRSLNLVPLDSSESC